MAEQPDVEASEPTTYPERGQVTVNSVRVRRFVWPPGWDIFSNGATFAVFDSLR